MPVKCLIGHQATILCTTKNRIVHQQQCVISIDSLGKGIQRVGKLLAWNIRCQVEIVTDQARAFFGEELLYLCSKVVRRTGWLYSTRYSHDITATTLDLCSFQVFCHGEDLPALGTIKDHSQGVFLLRWCAVKRMGSSTFPRKIYYLLASGEATMLS